MTFPEPGFFGEQNLSQWSWGVPPAAGGKREMVFRGLPRALGILRKTQFLRYYSVRWVNTERLVERETLLHRFGSKLNRIVFNSCGNPIIRSGNNT